jgi:hypothetical protein
VRVELIGLFPDSDESIVLQHIPLRQKIKILVEAMDLMRLVQQAQGLATKINKELVIYCDCAQYR